MLRADEWAGMTENDMWEAYREKSEHLTAVHKALADWKAVADRATDRVGELTKQLALRYRAEGCDKEELLAECIELRARLAAADAALDVAKRRNKTILELLRRVRGELSDLQRSIAGDIGEMLDTDKAAKGGRDET